MVYLHEIADPHFRAVTGSLGYISLGVGVVFGILMVVMMLSLVPAGGLAVTSAQADRYCWTIEASPMMITSSPVMDRRCNMTPSMSLFCVILCPLALLSQSCELLLSFLCCCR